MNNTFSNSDQMLVRVKKSEYSIFEVSLLILLSHDAMTAANSNVVPITKKLLGLKSI